MARTILDYDYQDISGHEFLLPLKAQVDMSADGILSRNETETGVIFRGRAGAINEERVREAAETGADTLAVACPYCTIMLDDGVRTSGRELRVADVATLLAESLGDAQ